MIVCALPSLNHFKPTFQALKTGHIMSKIVYSREINIQEKYKKLQGDISRWNDGAVFEKQFIEQIEHVEHLVFVKLMKLKDETRRRAKREVEKTIERTNELKERVSKTLEWFTSLQKDEQKLTEYERNFEEFEDKLNRLKKTTYSTCSHVDVFINNCEQLINVDPDDKENPEKKSNWTCTDFISIDQQRRQSVASSSFLVVSGNPFSNDREVSNFTNVSDAAVNIDNDFDESEDTSVTTLAKGVTIAKESDNGSCSESLVSGIEKQSIAVFPGEEYGAIKSISVSNGDSIVALDTEQRAYLLFDKSHKFILKSIFHVKDYPHDVECLDSEEQIISPATYGNVNYMLRVLSCGRNKKMKKIETTKLLCPMRQHCVSVRTKYNGCFLACIACPQELRLVSYTKNGRISRKYPQRAFDINDPVVADSLKQERYAVKLDEDAHEAYVIKSDKQSLNCFRLEGEPVAKTKWLYKQDSMAMSDLCVYRKHVFVVDNANGNILEIETAFGKLIKKIGLHPFDISNPFAITIKHNKIFLSEYTDRWGRNKELTKRRTITILSFKDT